MLKDKQLTHGMAIMAKSCYEQIYVSYIEFKLSPKRSNDKNISPNLTSVCSFVLPLEHAMSLENPNQASREQN